MDKIEKKIKQISNELFELDAEQPVQDCPEKDILSGYIQDSVKDKDKKIVEEHLINCDYCLDFVMKNKQIQGTLPDTPVLWIKKAKTLWTVQNQEERTGFFDIILKFAEETIEILKNPGLISVSYGAVAVPVRGENQSITTNHVTLNKCFPDIDTEIEVEKAGAGYVNIKVKAKDAKSDLPAKGLRISLSNPDRRIASYLAKDGEALFEGMQYGDYIIDFIKLRDEVGRIALSINK